MAAKQRDFYKDFLAIFLSFDTGKCTQIEAENESHLSEVNVRLTNRARLRALAPLLLMSFSAKLKEIRTVQKVFRL